MIIKLIEVPIRNVWEHEAKNFSNWLGNHLEYLDEKLGLNLSLEEIEKSVGSFFVDILAKDQNGNLVVIENQLEKTDHDHLGKLLTYLSNLDAKIAIWISPNPRTEHEAVMNYLNQISPEDTAFYLVKVQAYKIDDSRYAPLFTVVAGPEENLRTIGTIKKDLGAQDKKRYEFFKSLLDKSNQQSDLFNNVSAKGYQNWISAGAGKSGLSYVYSIQKKLANVHLYFGSSISEKNQERFKSLMKNKVEIEKKFGGELEWDYKEERKEQFLKYTINLGGLDDESNWEEMQTEMVNKMIKFELALREHINQLN